MEAARSSEELADTHFSYGTVGCWQETPCRVRRLEVVTDCGLRAVVARAVVIAGRLAGIRTENEHYVPEFSTHESSFPRFVYL